MLEPDAGPDLSGDSSRADAPDRDVEEAVFEVDEDILIEPRYYRCPKGHFKKLVYGVPADGSLHCPTCHRELERDLS
jgi:hypothetical protein